MVDVTEQLLPQCGGHGPRYGGCGGAHCGSENAGPEHIAYYEIASCFLPVLPNGDVLSLGVSNFISSFQYHNFNCVTCMYAKGT